MAIVFGANLISIHSCVHSWARCLWVYNLTMHPRVKLGWTLYTLNVELSLKLAIKGQGDPLIVKP